MASMTPEQAEYRTLLLRLEAGLFERLPQIFIATICRYGELMNEQLDAIFIEAARCVAKGEAVRPDIVASFRMRLERYHDVPGTPIFGSGHDLEADFDPWPVPE